MSEEHALKLIWRHDDKLMATAFLPPDATEYFVNLTKGAGMDPKEAVALTCMAFQGCLLTLTPRTADEIVAQDAKNGISYERKKYNDWIKEPDNEQA